MLGINHVTSATATTLGLSLASNQPFFLPLIAFVVFGSLLPDVDHSDSQISKSIPILSHFLKHRGPTHSLIGLLVFAGVCYLLLGIHPALSYIFIFFGFVGLSFLLQILENQVKQIKSITGKFFSSQQIKLTIGMVRMGFVAFFLMLMLFVWNQRLSIEIFWLLNIGYLVHILGDFLTKEGVPWFWPYKQRFALKLFKTGGLVEKIISFLLIVLNIVLTYMFVTHFEVLHSGYWQDYLSFLYTINWLETVNNLTIF